MPPRGSRTVGWKLNVDIRRSRSMPLAGLASNGGRDCEALVFVQVQRFCGCGSEGDGSYEGSTRSRELRRTAPRLRRTSGSYLVPSSRSSRADDYSRAAAKEARAGDGMHPALRPHPCRREIALSGPVRAARTTCTWPGWLPGWLPGCLAAWKESENLLKWRQAASAAWSTVAHQQAAVQ